MILWNLAPSFIAGARLCGLVGLIDMAHKFETSQLQMFESILDWPYQEMCGLDPKKPIMIAEWGMPIPV